MKHDQSLIRNFAIVAHIDHGKSTLADRLIEACDGLTSREMQAQVLDKMDIERERGITIKAQTVRLEYIARDGKTYILNLIDTPGHVDFTYEVSRSLAACEGALLIVDASQGIEAQTLVNAYLAVGNGLEILPVLNKIDLPAAEPDRILEEIENIIGLSTQDAQPVSAKSGQGIDNLLEAITQILPPPTIQNTDAPLKALLVDSWYDPYLGVVVLVRVVEGTIEKGQKIEMMSSGANYNIEKIGTFRPHETPCQALYPGEIGFFTAAIRNVSDTKIGDTITLQRNPAQEALQGFRESHPVVFCGLFPVDSSEFETLREAMAKLRLNDASFTHEVENSTALGFGFRCGFLGLLHLEIIRERIEREFSIDLITTAPSVVYEIALQDGTHMTLSSPADIPAATKIKAIYEPWIQATILVPEEHLGAIIKLCKDRRGEQTNMEYAAKRAIITYNLPLNEVVFDFYDRLKSLSRGYASFDYEFIDNREGDLVKMSILINAEPVDALAMIVHKSRAETRGRQICEKLKTLIPRHLFQIPIQASIGARIIARENISAMRKDVTAKCYGGDVSRKRKLLDKQKAGKKRMRQFGKVDIPHDAFINVLKMNDN